VSRVVTVVRAVAHGVDPGSVAVGAFADWIANREGVPFVLGGHPLLVTIRQNFTTSQTNAALLSVATGRVLVVTGVSVSSDNGTAADVPVLLGFGVTATPTGTGVFFAHPGIAPGGHVERGSGSGILGVGADGEDIRLTSGTPSLGSIDVVLTAFSLAS